ncbi:MAG: Monofunctional biosynthetic peptidoglycan transglycosylase [Proteobacteria bacterium]|nr:Monofunctional biosynthetic peptidoglycan transglycosylase [Pseudomonadota bacterium]
MLLEEWTLLITRAKDIQSKCQYIQISEELTTMLIVAEDHRFWSHAGVDLQSLARAAWKMLRGNKIEGGSTIAMQLVRVLTGRYQRTLKRKLIEIIFALGITKIIGKNDIPRIYLMIAYYGWQMNGIKQAAIRLNFDPKSITSYLAAEIVARLKYPEPQTPSIDRIKKIKTRASYILQRHTTSIPKK